MEEFVPKKDENAAVYSFLFTLSEASEATSTSA
jgi:hypothetical protein